MMSCFHRCYRPNDCPTDPIYVATEQDGKREYRRMRWRVAPYW